MNCPLCESPIIDYAPDVTAKHDGVEYHASCLYAERPDLKPEDDPLELLNPGRRYFKLLDDLYCK